jgi:hypothetical protein
MSKRWDRVLGFCTRHRYASPMLAKVGHACWNTVRTAGIFAVWRRAPITTVTITLVIGFWLYDYVSVSSAATASTSAPPPSIAAENVAPLAAPTLPETQPTNTGNQTQKKTRRTHHAKTAHSAFRRKRVGKNEVDYIANDVTIRLFTSVPTPSRVAHSTRQRHVGQDVTVRYFPPELARGPKTGHGSGVTQAAERSALVSK